MQPIVLTDIPFRIDRDALFKELRLPRDSDEAQSVRQLAEQAEATGRPKALYGPAYVERRTDSSVTLDGVTFSSRVLRVNLEAVHRVYPYVATCGMELEDWSAGIDDPLARYYAETIKQLVLGQAISALSRHLEALFSPGPTSAMNPGSLADWPLSEQRKLFALCGDTRGLIGVSLSPSCLMVPTKSVSGILFASAEQAFVNCQLCERPNCPGRRAPYDATLYARRYRLATADTHRNADVCSECGATLGLEHRPG